MIASDTLQIPCLLDESGAASFFESIDVDSSAVFRDAFVVMLDCW
jgi:hypothetical protein